MRDEKIATIYEGTNGIQALDLVGRKLGQRKGANVMNLAGVIQKNYRCKRKPIRNLPKYAAYSGRSLQCLLELTMFFAAGRQIGRFPPSHSQCLQVPGNLRRRHRRSLPDRSRPDRSQGNSTPSMKPRAPTSLGKKKGLQRTDTDAAFYSGRIASAKFFANEILTTVKARCEAVKANEKSPLEITDEAFSC